LSYLDRIRASVEPVSGRMFRVAESQEHVATTDIVDTSDEQSRLEELLEGNKPPYTDPVDHLHYLLKTPFRYPPLHYGSRFGQTFEKSLFYGAAKTETALAETAFYRFVFIHHTQKPFPRPVKSQHTLFEVAVQTDKGLKLQSQDWQDVRAMLTDPVDYRFTQRLGSDMRSVGIEAFQFISARAVQVGIRSPDHHSTVDGLRDLNADCAGINWALFTPRAFQESSPSNPRQMIAVATNEKVSIVVTEPDGSSTAVAFPANAFMVSGQMPRPAA